MAARQPEKRHASVEEVFVGLLKKAAAPSGGRHITVGTLCSGTDAPLMAVRRMMEAAEAAGLCDCFSFSHLYSCEIEGWKQRFIGRNARPTGPVFVDAVDVARAEDGRA
jgi:hypothetical protein